MATGPVGPPCCLSLGTSDSLWNYTDVTQLINTSTTTEIQNLVSGHSRTSSSQLCVGSDLQVTVSPEQHMKLISPVTADVTADVTV